MNGKNSWYIVDGYRPSPEPNPKDVYVGHECISILNTNDCDAKLLISIYFEDRDPIENIPMTIPAKRLKCFRTSEKDLLGGFEIKVGVQYSMQIKSDVGIIVQYGKLDVQQPNMAYMSLMAHSE